MKKIFLILCITLVSATGFSQADYTPTDSNLEARQWFENAKFGMFIHWGVYSILGDGEWVMHHQNIQIDRYELLPTFFNPQEFNAEDIVKLAKMAGMKYITFTTKHHDGFAMYDSKVSDYSIVKSSPYGKDIFRDLEQACKKHGIKLFAYYSQLDWHHPDYFPLGKTGTGVGRVKDGDWNTYLKYQNAQIREIAKNYDIAGFWFDGFWDRLEMKGRTPETRKQGEDLWDIVGTYNMVHKIKPALLIGNNHHIAPFPGEDFQMFEKDLPGKSTTNFGSASISDLPLETCETINHSWGFNLQDDKHKSVEQLIHYIVNAAGRGGNFLLNVGPMPNGKIQENHVERLKKVGDWLKEHGETIYHTSAGGYLMEGDFVTTTTEDKLYVHVLNSELKSIKIHDFKARIKNMAVYKSQKNIKYQMKKGILTFDIPPEESNRLDRIIEIRLKK
ncbi:alpha-L-fucosidase [Seonamhaeicola sp.]|uniref:alpha-L-fucosidase n=1 Tax=Seonamhaeicola sp. TaxID=1912245 RepID=UPI002633B499|nr:alpha-L-fucosidase [Seonamhaeicola sp.]